MPHCAAKPPHALRCGAVRCGAVLAGNIGAEVETFIRENKVWLDSRRYSAVPWHCGAPPFKAYSQQRRVLCSVQQAFLLAEDDTFEQSFGFARSITVAHSHGMARRMHATRQTRAITLYIL